MLRNIFPDGPPSDQDASQAADDPGAFFSEFLPCNIKAKGSSLKAATQQKEATNAAAQASAIEATAAARAFAAQAAQSAYAADKPAAADIQQGSTAAAAAADEEHAIDSKTSDFLPVLPSITEIRAAAAAAWFGDSPYITSPTAAADHKDTQSSSSSSAAAAAAAPLPAVAEGADSEESEGLFEKLLPFGKDCSLRLKTADLVPGFRPRRHKPKPKPLRLKLAEQVLSKELLSAVQVVESEILSSPDPLPSATIKFFLKAGRSMGQGWASKNATRVFGFLTAYVAATCGVMHGAKAAVKWLAWRVPRWGNRVAGPAVGFTADVLLPTSFFGPWLATYVLIRLLCKPPKTAEELQAEAEAAEAPAAAATAAAADAISSTQQQQQQQSQQEAQLARTRSRELQLEFVVDEPSQGFSFSRRQLRGHRPLARASSIRTKARNRMGKVVGCASPTAAAAADEGVISADAISCRAAPTRPVD